MSRNNNNNNNNNNIIESLSIFNPKFNFKNSENIDEVKKEIIYYYPQNVPIVDQIKHIGLAKAIIKFTNTFQLKDTNNTVHSQKFRQIIIQPEKDFWISMKINMENFQRLKINQYGQDNVEYINKQLNDTYLEAKLNMLYSKFRLFNDSFSNILNDDSVDSLKLKTRLYFDVCIPYFNFDNIDLFSTITGLNMISLNRTIESEIENFIDKVHKNFQFTSGSMIFWKNNVIYNDMDFSYLKDMTVLYDYLIDPNISSMPFLKINTLQRNKPIIKSTHFSVSSNTAQPSPSQNKTTLLQSIKSLNLFTSKDTHQNTGFLTGPLSLNNHQIIGESVSSKASSKDTSSRSLFSISSSFYGSKDDVSKQEVNQEREIEEESSQNEKKILVGHELTNEPVMEDENNISLPQIIYLGDYGEPYYLIIYKYLEEITALFFIKVNNNIQDFEDTYVSLSKLRKESITSFDAINIKEEGDSVIDTKSKLGSEEFYYSLEATIRSDLDTILANIESLKESQINSIDDQYKYIIFKHSKMLVKTSKGYLKQPGLNKLISQYILDLYSDMEKKQNCSEICVRSYNSIWIAIKRQEQCDYILILPRNSFKVLSEIDGKKYKRIYKYI
ncbi:hypothetical protein BCR36DRAFT_142915 [Piromyces finnis]|uniref:CCZ1/INTU/HSP4 first Longin domain-containing protein n=1 Tax=Piromyces finnis TaxID=1754191 RepID=A0A1Y1UYK1_9FUNG|nr:hypothetical protein BCR36DRAFT_142915 [Piromyces finnis]|eukprot:ORX43510.1 hypothetical protein BCR36DRAFT_142915 [Piromyces finnis]